MSLTIGNDVVVDRTTRRGPRRGLYIAGVALVAAIVLLSVIRLLTGTNNLLGHGIVTAALGASIPIALAGLGGVWCERAGVVNIGLEGMMILGTWGSAYFSLQWGPWWGILGGMLLGLVGGAIHALATVYFGVDHIISGVAINIIGLGAAKFLAMQVWPEEQGQQSPRLPTLPEITVPGLSDGLQSVEKEGWFLVSEVAGLLGGMVTRVNVLIPLAIALIVGSWWLLWRTPFGLRLRSCGESPAAAESLGVNVYFYKAIAVLASGALAGLAGSWLAIAAAGQFADGQTGGRGYIGLAAMIFGNWRPGAMFGGSLLFGYTDAAQLRGSEDTVHVVVLIIGILLLAYGSWMLVRRSSRGTAIVAAGLGGLLIVWWLMSDKVPTEFTPYLPHMVTLLVTGLASQRLRMPAADGVVYRKGEHT